MLYRFGSFVLRESSCVLEREGCALPLRRQAFLVLRHLVAHRERLVSKRELFDEIWPGARVTDNALSQCLAEIRRALGDDGTGQRMIRTRHGVGFQFVAEARSEQEEIVIVERPRSSLAAPAQRRAVLMMLLRPFSFAGAEKLEAELAIEVEHELLRQLVKKSPIPVIHARSLCAAHAGEDPDLDAAFVVEGRVQRLGEWVRLRVRIIETETRTAIWAERYDARFNQLLADEDAVARSAAEGGLRATIRVLSRRSEQQALKNLDDRELAIRGIEQFYRRERHANQRAIEYLTELSARGSKALAVRSYLGRAHYRNIYYLWDDDWIHSIEQVRTAASECLAIDERDPAGPLLLALTRVFEGDGDQAVALADRVVSAWPDMPEARCLHAEFLMLRGHCHDAIQSVRGALRGRGLEAARGEYAAAVAGAYFYSDRYAEARAMARRAIVDHPNSVLYHMLSAVAAWHLGELQALELARLRRMQFSYRPLIGILASTPLNMRKHLFGSLESMGLIGSEWQNADEAGPAPPDSQLRVGGMPNTE